MWTKALIPVLASLCCCLIINTAESIGVIRPDDPYGFINETLNLTCHVTHLNITGNISGSLFFTNQWDGEERVIPIQYVSEMDARTILLEYVVQSGNDQGPFICKVNQSDRNSLIVAKQYVTVEYRAVAVQEMHCQVYNWENMTCSWDLGQEYINTDLLRVQLYWTILGDKWYNCPHETQTSCTWLALDDKDMLHPEATYYLIVVVKTISKSNETMDKATSDFFIVKAIELVKPAPVQNVTVVSRTSTCITLSWQRSRRHREFRYQLSWQGLETWDNDTTSDTNLTVCHLHPAVKYTFLISSIPIPPGYTEPKGTYSDLTAVHVTTLEDVPSGVPGVHTGSFTYGECTQQTTCSITLYWKSVPEQERNGVITTYNVTMWRPNSPGNSTHVFVDGSKRSYELTDLYPDSDYMVELQAGTEVGYSEKSSFIYLPSRQKQIPLLSRFLVESLGSSLLISWGPPAETKTTSTLSVIGYTLYNCTGSSFTCRDEIQWKHLSSNQTSYMFNVTDGNLDNKMLGISLDVIVANRTQSSGITWKKCIYQKNKKPPKVQNVHFPSDQPHNALRVEWERITCMRTPVYVTHYVITHCRVSQRGCEGQPVNDTVENNDASHEIKKLAAGVNYQVTLLAVSEAGEGPESEPIRTKVTSNELDRGTIVGLAVGSAFFLVFLLSAVIICIRVIRKKCGNILYTIELPKIKDEPDDTGQYKILFNNNSNTKTQVPKLPLKAKSMAETVNSSIPANTKREADCGLSIACISVSVHQTDLSVQDVTDSPSIKISTENQTTNKPPDLSMTKVWKNNPSNQRNGINKTVKDMLEDDVSSQNNDADKTAGEIFRENSVDREVFKENSVDREVIRENSVENNSTVSGYIKIGCVSGEIQKCESQCSSGSVDSRSSFSNYRTAKSSNKATLCDLKPKHNSVAKLLSSNHSSCQTKLCSNPVQDVLSDYVPNGQTIGKEAFCLCAYGPTVPQHGVVDAKESYL